jgi:hypothetical protein
LCQQNRFQQEAIKGQGCGLPAATRYQKALSDLSFRVRWTADISHWAFHPKLDAKLPFAVLDLNGSEGWRTDNPRRRVQ